MAVLSDSQIIEAVEKFDMISPFVAEQVRESDGQKVISYGLSSFGYDISLDNLFRFPVTFPTLAQIPDNETGQDRVVYYPNPPFLDVKNELSQTLWHPEVEINTPVDIPAGGFVLACSYEHFNMPDDVIGIVVGKSTYARVGLIVNVTPIEPGWRGFITLELLNPTQFPIRIYPREGIAQLVFLRGEKPLVSYADRNGKYQDQISVTLAKV